MGSQPDHKVAFSALIDACAYTVINVENLDEQKESDAAEVRRQEEEKRQKERMA